MCFIHFDRIVMNRQASYKIFISPNKHLCFSVIDKKTFFFEVFVGKSVDAEKFGSAKLKIDRENTVVNDACLVSFAISRDNNYRM